MDYEADANQNGARRYAAVRLQVLCNTIQAVHLEPLAPALLGEKDIEAEPHSSLPK